MLHKIHLHSFLPAKQITEPTVIFFQQKFMIKLLLLELGDSNEYL